MDNNKYFGYPLENYSSESFIQSAKTLKCQTIRIFIIMLQ